MRAAPARETAGAGANGIRLGMTAHPLHHLDDATVSVSGDGRPVGVIDIGSNSVRFVVFAGLTRAPVQLFNEKSACALGAGLQTSGVLNPAGRECAVTAVGRFVRLARAMGVGRLELLATAAVRDARDGPALVAELKERFDVDVNVLSGDDEGRLAALGVLLGTPDADGVVADLGGGSLELVEIDGGQVDPLGRLRSFPLGVLRLDDIERTGGEAAVDAAIKAELAKAPWIAERPVKTLYAVGGSWRAMAKLCMMQENHPLQVLDKYTLSRGKALELSDLVARIGRRSLDKISGVSRRRLVVLPHAARLLAALLATIRPERVVFSIHGMREGFYYTLMPEAIRDRDPIVDMCEAVAGNGHRFAQQPAVLMRFLDPLFPDETEKQHRQRFAACMLGDLYWDEHPDFRGQQAFFKTLRLPVVGFDHEDRAALALMVLYRYQSYDEIHDAQDVLALLAPDDRVRVQAVGCGLRLAHVISGGAPGILGNCRLILEPKRLVLRIPGEDPAFDVGAFDKRLERLARLLGRDPAIEVA
ncbi:Exopolyphosphatase [uncultured Alphaproteobacteria bacterium]|uniref:Exopolyphosphatase n=1 Tax=uncultured Alphaproteobacteria bacterium TaxID=91750 RepID=A0A212JJ95_9PROT|nr:Exopolyphosphatase [uncultured Alphaproteobacteria bacterium]